MNNRPPRSCDCGKPGVKRDGSGWFCLDCERAVHQAGRLVLTMINEQRQGNYDGREDRRREYLRNYERA